MSLEVLGGRGRRLRGPYIILQVFMVEKTILSFMFNMHQREIIEVACFR